MQHHNLPLRDHCQIRSPQFPARNQQHRILFQIALILSTLQFAWASSQAAQTPPQPNIVLINVDDLGYADTGPYGSVTNTTPHLDQLAAEGCRMTCHYAHPVCSPSRAALMTGCYPKRALPIPHVLFPQSAVGLHPDEITIAEILKEQGYATACFGKWHLGDQPEFLPTRQGFDEYFGIPYSNDMGPAADGARSTLGKITPNQLKPGKSQMFDYGIVGSHQPPLPLLSNEQVVDRVKVPEQFQVTQQYTQRAQRFIRAHQQERFFLYLPHTAVHFPLYPSKEFQGTSRGGPIGDWVQEVDWSVGQILKTLQELDLDDQTLVMFTSDNGGALKFGSVNTPLRGSKNETWEGGVRVPFLVRWPGHIPPGRTSDEITTMMDLLPTLATLAGGTIPDDRKIDGMNVWPIWTGAAEHASRNEFFYFRGAQLEAVRQGPWKLHLRSGELYNLAADIGEQKNLADSEPEVSRQLRELAGTTAGDLGMDDFGPGCRPLGRVSNPQPLIPNDIAPVESSRDD